MEYIVTLEDARGQQTYELDATGCRTWAELRSSLPDEDIEFLSVCKLEHKDTGIVITDEDKEEIDFDSGRPSVRLKFKNIHVNLHDRGVTHTFDVPLNARVREVRELFAKVDTRRHVQADPVTYLSYKGAEIKDQEMELIALGIKEDNATLMSKRRVAIEDKDCELETVIEVFDTTPLSEAARIYCVEAKRVHRAQCELNLNEQFTLDQDETVYSAFHQQTQQDELLNSDDYFDAVDEKETLKLEFTSPVFSVTISDKSVTDMNVPVDVKDSDTIETLKINYTNVTHGDGLVDSDKLWFGDTELDERKMVIKYKIPERTIIYIEREDTSQTFTVYVCSDCGQDVRLKQKDTVRCRECGNRIVYKKRTLAPVQYLAR